MSINNNCPSIEELVIALTSLGLEKVEPVTTQWSKLYCILSEEIKRDLKSILGLSNENIPDVAYVPDWIPLDLEHEPYTYISTITWQYILMQLRSWSFQKILTRDNSYIFISEFWRKAWWKIEKKHGVFMKKN